MDQPRRAVPWTRRQLLSSAATFVGASIVGCLRWNRLDCDPGEERRGHRRRSSPAASAVPAASAAPVASAAAASVAPTKDLTIVAGKFNVWFSANWNIVTDEAVGAVFVDWGKQNNVQVEWQSIPGSPLILPEGISTLAAGQPPEIDNNNQVYWYTQGEMGDLKPLVTKFKDQAGGMYPTATTSLTATDGGMFATPYAVDCWPAHWRKDVDRRQEDGGKFFETWSR